MKLSRLASVNWREIGARVMASMSKRSAGTGSLMGQFSRWFHFRRCSASLMLGSISIRVRAVMVRLRPERCAGDEMRRIVGFDFHVTVDETRGPEMDKVASLLSSQIMTLNVFTGLLSFDGPV